MRIVFQRPRLGESEHDYRWGVIDGGGVLLSTWSSPEAAFIEAAAVLDVDIATLSLIRSGPGAFRVGRR